jgi:hypothetical protein
LSNNWIAFLEKSNDIKLSFAWSVIVFKKIVLSLQQSFFIFLLPQRHLLVFKLKKSIEVILLPQK